MKKKLLIAAAAGLAATAVCASVAAAAPSATTTKYANTFSHDMGDWKSLDGRPSLTLSKTNRVIATMGNPYSMFDGTINTMDWPAKGYIAQLDVYLDPASMTPGQGFDLSVASNNKSGTHLRDFIFHVGMTASREVRVAADNNSSDPARVNDSVLGGGSVIATAGWYTFEHTFHNVGGTLVVDLSVTNKDGVPVFTDTLNAGDVIANVVGGPRYQWFTFINGTIQFDNQRLALIK